MEVVERNEARFFKRFISPHRQVVKPSPLHGEDPVSNTGAVTSGSVENLTVNIVVCGFVLGKRYRYCKYPALAEGSNGKSAFFVS